MDNCETKKKFEDIHLTDNSLFTSVLKHKRACEIVLSIMFQKERKDIHLKAVEVEKVILNEEGKRAIRLDVYAYDGYDNYEKNDTLYDIEMQREVNDNLPKRSRYYQSLMDSPILKSGKETKYRNLPKTFIIFITEQDFLGRGLACYTFKNYCEEIRDLELGDGAVKIFLNLESKNGEAVLVEMLQYIKESRLTDSQKQKVDSRIIELNEIVEEVKESVEWEEIHMTILEQGKEIGKEIGKELGKELGSKERLVKQVLSKDKKGYSNSTIAEHLEITEQEVDVILGVIKQYPNATIEELVEEVNSRSGV